MKKLFIAAMLVAGIGASAFAYDGTKVNFKVKNSFEREFIGAKNVSWTVGANFTKASFLMEEDKVEAFYSVEGESLGYTRQIEFKKLPLNAIQRIRKDYPTYQPTETIEYIQSDNKNYYVSLKDGNKQLIVEVSSFGSINKFTPSKE